MATASFPGWINLSRRISLRNLLLTRHRHAFSTSQSHSDEESFWEGLFALKRLMQIACTLSLHFLSILSTVMPVSFVHLLVILHAALVSSSVLQHQNQNDHGLVLNSTPDSAIEAHQSLDPWSAIPALNISHPLFNSSLMEQNLTASPLPTPDCNGQLYGYNLDYESCFEAWKLIPRDTLGRTFGSRSDDYTFDVPTPFLFMSCKPL